MACSSVFLDFGIDSFVFMLYFESILVQDRYVNMSIRSSIGFRTSRDRCSFLSEISVFFKTMNFFLRDFSLSLFYNLGVIFKYFTMPSFFLSFSPPIPVPRIKNNNIVYPFHKEIHKHCAPHFWVYIPRCDLQMTWNTS